MKWQIIYEIKRKHYIESVDQFVKRIRQFWILLDKLTQVRSPTARSVKMLPL